MGRRARAVCERVCGSRAHTPSTTHGCAWHSGKEGHEVLGWDGPAYRAEVASGNMVYVCTSHCSTPPQ